MRGLNIGSIGFYPKQEWLNLGSRGAQAALPFLSLYKPLGRPLSLATGGLRVVSCLMEFYQTPSQKTLYHTAGAIASIGATVFKHPLGQLVAAGYDLIEEASQLREHLEKGDYQKAFEASFNLVNQALYIGLILNGGLELSIASLAIQIMLGVYHAREEFKQGHYIEAAGHAGMALVNTHQITGEIQTLQKRWAFEKFVASLGGVYPGEILTGKLDPALYPVSENECRIFLVRHAETEWNSIGKSQGWNDIPLNEEGLKQAAFLGECFADLPIGQIYASSLTRAVQTSEALSRHHPDATVVLDPAIRFYDPNTKKPRENESEAEMDARITQEIIEAATAYIRKICAQAKGQNVIIVTHGKVIKSLLYGLGGEVMRTSKIKIDNGAIVRILGSDSGLSLDGNIN
jgi:broad specificity phosphatase PhoE